MLKILLYLVKVLGGAFIIISAMLYFFQGKFVYHPGKKFIGTPDAIGIAFEEVLFQSMSGAKLHGWYVPGKPGKYTVLFCHGNAGNISNRLKTLKIMHDLGYNFFIFDYQGYGKSEGSPSEEGTYQDTRGALNYLKKVKKCSMDQIIFHARSLGGGICSKIAAEEKARIFILESTFTSIKELAKTIYPYLPVEYLTRIHYPTQENLKKLSCPILFMHSPTDEVIPFAHGKKLYETYNGEKSWLQLTGGHNDGIYVSEKEYIAAIQTFLEKNLK